MIETVNVRTGTKLLLVAFMVIIGCVLGISIICYLNFIPIWAAPYARGGFSVLSTLLGELLVGQVLLFYCAIRVRRNKSTLSDCAILAGIQPSMLDCFRDITHIPNIIVLLTFILTITMNYVMGSAIRAGHQLQSVSIAGMAINNSYSEDYDLGVLGYYGNHSGFTHAAQAIGAVKGNHKHKYVWVNNQSLSAGEWTTWQEWAVDITCDPVNYTDILGLSGASEFVYNLTYNGSVYDTFSGAAEIRPGAANLRASSYKAAKNGTYLDKSDGSLLLMYASVGWNQAQDPTIIMSGGVNSTYLYGTTTDGTAVPVKYINAHCKVSITLLECRGDPQGIKRCYPMSLQMTPGSLADSMGHDNAGNLINSISVGTIYGSALVDEQEDGQAFLFTIEEALNLDLLKNNIHSMYTEWLNIYTPRQPAMLPEFRNIPTVYMPAGYFYGIICYCIIGIAAGIGGVCGALLTRPEQTLLQSPMHLLRTVAVSPYLTKEYEGRCAEEPKDLPSRLSFTLGNGKLFGHVELCKPKLAAAFRPGPYAGNLVAVYGPTVRFVTNMGKRVNDLAASGRRMEPNGKSKELVLVGTGQKQEWTVIGLSSATLAVDLISALSGVKHSVRSPTVKSNSSIRCLKKGKPSCKGNSPSTSSDGGTSSDTGDSDSDTSRTVGLGNRRHLLAAVAKPRIGRQAISNLRSYVDTIHKKCQRADCKEARISISINTGLDTAMGQLLSTCSLTTNQHVILLSRVLTCVGLDSCAWFNT